jgi:diacylglycerol O-acyltransferase / wax synthase
MNKPVPSRSMSPVDAAFLYLERKEIPLNIASVCVFDGPIPFQDFVASINAKLHLVPRYTQIAMVPAWSLGLPTWQDDPHFDIRRHIFQARLEPPGGDAELQALAGKIFSELMDRSKPLWDMHVVDGLKDGRGAIILRVHHALADGIAGMELLKVMLDETPEVTYRVGAPRPRPRRRKAQERSLADDIFNTVNSTLGGLFAFEAGVLDFAKAMLQGKGQSDIKGLLKVLPEFAASVERLPFNKPCTGERKFCWTEFRLNEVQAVREAAGGTVNDVILAVLTRALARYVKLHGQSVVNRFVRIVCPVSLRLGGSNGDLGNQISFLPVALPMDAHGPIRMLQAVAARTEAMKRSGAAGLVGLLAKWIAAAPPPLQALFWRGIPDLILPVPLFNLICTNVIGSPTPLYAIGRRMLASYPQVPTGYDLGVGCAVHSYEGKLFFGLIADAHAAPDVERLRDFLNQSFDELRRSAATKKARGAGRAKRPAPVQEQQPAERLRAAARESQKPEAAPAASPAPIAEHAKEAA